MKNDTAFIVGVILVALILIGVGPLITIWSINVILASLQLTTIAYTFKTWLATLLLQMTLGGIVGAGKSE